MTARNGTRTTSKKDDKAGDASFFSTLPPEAFYANGPGSPVQHVYMYGPVSAESLRELRMDIDQACRGTVDMSGKEAAPRPIVLHINSPGGDAFSGISMMSIFNESRVPICACVDGISASAATFLSVLAPYRVFAEGAVCLVHDYASFEFGKREDLIFSVTVENEMLTNTIKKMYLRHSRMKPEQLDQLMKRDLLLDADQCVKMGLCERVLKVKGSKLQQAPLPLAVALRKTNLNHVRFVCNSLGISQQLDELIGTNSLKPVVLHADGMACIYSVLDHVTPIAQRISSLSAVTHTYGVIDTHVDITNVLPLLLCRHRVMYSHAAVRVHLVYSGAWAWTIRDAMANTELMIDRVRSMLREHTKVPADILDGLDRQRYMLTAADCLKYGIVHTVIDGA